MIRRNLGALLILSLFLIFDFGYSNGVSPQPPAFCRGDHQFYCSESDKCLPKSQRCNGNRECEKGEDEANCTVCTKENADSLDKFFCANSEKCIDKDWVCDGFADCEDTLEKSEEEQNCVADRCTSEQFSCGDGQCLDLSWRCDHQVDCQNGADEQNCNEVVCLAGTEKRCNASGTEPAKCISMRWVCDGDKDCIGGDDEIGCSNSNTCADNEFACRSDYGNGTSKLECIPNRWKCDDEKDCENGADEQNCEEPSTVKTSNHLCTTLEFTCKSGPVPCVLKGWRCDGQNDCIDGSDEEGCGDDKLVCGNGEFACHADNICIPSLLKCSGKPECSDGADELNCGNATQGYCDKTRRQFSCVAGKVGSCIDMDLVCDNKCDCPDGCRDENRDLFCSDSVPNDRCGGGECGNANCTTLYANNDRGASVDFMCHCEDGYVYNSHRKTCVDINECEIENRGSPVCDHLCVNLNGTYKCECEEGYSLQKDGVTCKASGLVKPTLIFTNRHQIRSLNISSHSLNYMPLVDSKAAVAIDFDYSQELVFYTDMTERKIYSFKMPSEQQETDPELIDMGIPGINTPDGLAYDWIYKHLFWTDTASNTINVACIEQGDKYHAVLYKNENEKCLNAETAEQSGNCIDEPRALVIHPQKGWMFWSDWGKNPNIMKANIDGSGMEKIVYNRHDQVLLAWPNGLTLDITTAAGHERLYWIDARLASVFSCTLYNCMNDARVLAYDQQNIKHPFSITVFENKLFWSDWHHRRIVSANKFTGGNISHIVNNLEQPMDLKVYHPVTQPAGVNHCDDLSDGDKCEHICVPKAWTKSSPSATVGGRRSFVPVSEGPKHTCLCASGYKLNSTDGRSCILIPTPVPPTRPSPVLLARKASGDDSPGMNVGMNVGVVAAIASSAVLLVAVVIGVIGFIVMRSIKRNKAKNMNFDNPIYKRTTEDKLELPRHEYQPSQTIPASMVPLTSEESISSATLDEDGGCNI